MNTIQPQEFVDRGVKRGSDLTIEELRRQLSAIFSRDNLGLRYRSLSADTTLTNKDSVVMVDTSGGSKTITLAYANSWSSVRTTPVTIVKTSESNTLTVSAQGSDTLKYWNQGVTITSGSITTAGVLLLVSDGSSTWYAISGIGASLVPKYAICRITANQTGITADTLVSSLSTTLSGFSVASDVLTCSTGSGGLYAIDIVAPWSVNAVAGTVKFGYKINGGTSVFPFSEVTAASQGKVFSGRVIRYLANSDTIEFRVDATTTTMTLIADATFTLTQLA